MKLYWGSGSPYAWRAMLALIVKGIEFEDELLQFSKKEHKTPAYLQLNPRGKVPTLVDGETVVRESLAIITYVDRKEASHPLYGETAAEAGHIARLVAEHEAYLGPAAMAAMRPVFQGKVKERADEIREATQPLAEELNRFEAELGEARWFGGESVSAADVVVYPTLELVDRLAAKPELQALQLGVPQIAQSNPGLHAWRNRFRELPGVDRAYPPHWR